MSLALKFWGPMTITFNDITTGSKAYSGIKRDTITINVETLAYRCAIEDGSASHTADARRVVVARPRGPGPVVKRFKGHPVGAVG